MMQSGLSRQLFEAWCTDKRNGLIVAGYCVEGTLAKVMGGGREGEERECLCVCVFARGEGGRFVVRPMYMYILIFMSHNFVL